MTSYADDLRERFYIVSQNFPSTEQVLVQALFALITREHVLWYSLPGRAKSQIAKSILGMFDGVQPYFAVQCTKDTPEEKIFGNIIPNRMMEAGEEIYNLDGGLVTSTFAFLDEFMDLSDMIMRSANSVLNEREFYTKDMGTIGSPLHTAIATSNYLRQREATQAVIDRFMCKGYLRGVDGLGDSMRALDTYMGYAGKRIALAPLPYEGLAELSDMVSLPESAGGIAVSNGMRLLLVLLVTEFQRRRIAGAEKRWQEENPDGDAADMPTPPELGVPDISPRTMVKLVDLARASAVLENRATVLQSDLKGIEYGLLTIGDQSGDDAIWADVCRDLLGHSDSAMKLVESLGSLAIEVGTIEAQRSLTSNAQLFIGGKFYSASQLRGQQLRQLFSGNRKNLAVNLAVDMIGADLDRLSVPRVGFDLKKGWL